MTSPLPSAKATRELTQAGPDAADMLSQTLHNNPSAETKRRIEELLSRLKKGRRSEALAVFARSKCWSASALPKPRNCYESWRASDRQSIFGKKCEPACGAWAMRTRKLNRAATVRERFVVPLPNGRGSVFLSRDR